MRVFFFVSYLPKYICVVNIYTHISIIVKCLWYSCVVYVISVNIFPRCLTCAYISTAVHVTSGNTRVACDTCVHISEIMRIKAIPLSCILPVPISLCGLSAVPVIPQELSDCPEAHLITAVGVKLPDSLCVMHVSCANISRCYACCQIKYLCV